MNRLLLLLLGLALLAAAGPVAAGEPWGWRVFERDYERFVYALTTYTPDYGPWAWALDEDYGELSDEELEEWWQEQEAAASAPGFSVTWQEETVYFTLEVTRTDTDTVAVSTSYTYSMPVWDLQNPVDVFAGFFGPPSGFQGSSWVGQLLLISVYGGDLVLAEGYSLDLDDGWLQVESRRSVAGVEGYLCRIYRWEMDPNQELQGRPVSEWVLAPRVGLPLSGRVYEEGHLVYKMELQDYAAR